MWNQGIGQILMDAALKQARQEKIEHLILEVEKSNTQAIHLYKNGV